MEQPLNVQINFIPGRPGPRRLMWISAIIVAVTFLAGWLGFNFWSHKMELTAKGVQNSELAAQILQNQAQHESLNHFLMMESDAAARQAAATEASDERRSPVRILREIFTLVPPGMELTEVEIKPHSVIVKGRCPAFLSLSEFVAAADGHPNLGGVGKVMSDTKMLPQQVEFAVELGLPGTGT